MNENSTFFDVLLQSIRLSSSYDPLDEEAPQAIFWPDWAKEWSPILPRLREYYPILTLGDFQSNDTEGRTGPAAWVRCMLVNVLHDRLPPNVIPIVYLPGISSKILCQPNRRLVHLDPLVSTLYRSVVWSKREIQDWTVAEYFQDKDTGLGIQVISDDDRARQAMRRALPALCDLTLRQLRDEEPWKVGDFERLKETTIRNLILMGESAELEFKASARWDIDEEKQNPLLEKIIVKTIAGFLNSPKGGTLLIGVEDDGKICGVELDYQTFREDRRNKDAYEQWLMRHFMNAFGIEFTQFIHVQFYSESNGTVCKITADPSPKPAFVEEVDKNGRKSHIFYLRTGNATNILDMPTAFGYFRNRWC